MKSILYSNFIQNDLIQIGIGFFPTLEKKDKSEQNSIVNFFLFVSVRCRC